MLSNLAILLGVGGIILMLVNSDRSYGTLVVGSIIAYAVLKAVRYFHGIGLSCPLCHGSVIVNQRTPKHRHARRYLLFGYRASTILDIVFRRVFNCMYCGTPFRLSRHK